MPFAKTNHRIIATYGVGSGNATAKVLTGEATCEDLPYEIIENYDLYINSEALDAMGITVPDEVAQTAVEANAA